MATSRNTVEPARRRRGSIQSSFYPLRTAVLVAVPLFTALALTLAQESADAKTRRDWQTGKVLDSQRSQFLAGTRDRPGVVLSNGTRITNDSKRAVYEEQQTVEIESETHTFTVLESFGRSGKPANVTVNGPVKFAIDGTTLYLIDDDGKEHKTEIIKKVLRTLRTPEQSQAPKP